MSKKPTNTHILTIPADALEAWRAYINDDLKAIGHGTLRVQARGATGRRTESGDIPLAEADTIKLFTVTRSSPARRLDIPKKDLTKIKRRVSRRHGADVSVSLFNRDYQPLRTSAL